MFQRLRRSDYRSVRVHQYSDDCANFGNSASTEHAVHLSEVLGIENLVPGSLNIGEQVRRRSIGVRKPFHDMRGIYRA